MRRETKTKMSMAAGTLMLFAFIMAILTASGLLFLEIGAIDLEENLNDEQLEQIDENMMESILNACGVLLVVAGFFLLVGGIFALKRTHWGISLFGALIGLISIGPQFLGSILSLVALLLIILSKDAFRGKSDDEYLESSGVMEQTPPESLVDKKERIPCPTCGASMRYDEEYEKWYCKNCQEYK